MAAEISAAIFIGYKELCVNPPVSMAVVSRLEMTPLPDMRIHRYRDERLLIRCAHPRLKSWAGARDSQANC